MAPAAAAVLTASTLALVQAQVSPPMLLPERFVPGLGWLLVIGLGLYAAWITRHMLDPRQQPRWRRGIWRAFDSHGLRSPRSRATTSS